MKLGYLLSFLFALSASAENRLDRVTVRGNQRIESETILLQIQARPGAAVTPESVASDIKQIYRTGFFENVAADTVTEGGATVLTFEVQEKPAIRGVFLKGNEEVKDDTLKEKLDLGARRFLDRKKINAALEQGRLYYQSLGFYDAELSFREELVEDNQVDLTIDIKEGKKVRIQEIVFDGAKLVDSDDLEDVISTSTYSSWISWISGAGTLKKEELDQDARELQRHYLTKGFADVRVGEPEIERIEDGLKVVFKIVEGEEYTFGKLSAQGDLINNSVSETLDGIKAKEGETFNAELIRSDTFIVSEKFTDKGYAFANITPDTQVNREKRSIDIAFQIDKGKEVYVDRITVSGNRKTLDNVVRRSMQLQEQERFSSSKVKRSQEILQRQGYFDEVTISPEPAGEEGKVDLNVAVREANTGTFSIGAGISAGEGFIIQSQISENNLFGTGNSLSLDANNGARRDTYILSFNNPRVNDTYLSFGVDGGSRRLFFGDFDRSQAGAGVTVGYPISLLGEDLKEDIRASLNYDLSSISISDIDPLAAQFVKDQEGDTIASAITPRLIRNTINNPLDPSTGSRQNLQVEIAGLGGDQEFYLGNFTNSFFYPFWDSPVGQLVFSHRFRIDWGETYNDEPFPLYRRFFPGGINSVRGYDWRRMGPADENGRRFGGSKQVVNNFEVIFPIAESIGLRGVAFYDIGDAFGDDENPSWGKMRGAVGWGIRWRSPIAPIRIEFGYPLDKEEGDGGVVTNFSFGQPLF